MFEIVPLLLTGKQTESERSQDDCERNGLTPYESLQGN